MIINRFNVESTSAVIRDYHST